MGGGSGAELQSSPGHRSSACTGGHQRFTRGCVTWGNDRVQEAKAQTQGGCIMAAVRSSMGAVA